MTIKSKDLGLLLDHMSKDANLPVHIELLNTSDSKTGTKTVGVRSAVRGYDFDEGKLILQPEEELTYKDKTSKYQEERDEIESKGLVSKESLSYYNERDLLVKEVSYLVQNKGSKLTVSQLEDIKDILNS